MVGVTSKLKERVCPYCGKTLKRKQYSNGQWESDLQFSIRKYCDRECMKRAFVERNGANQDYSSAHHSSRKIVYLIDERKRVCELCGSTKNIDVHHKDGNFQNNSQDNLVTVCRSCHMKIHRQVPVKLCKICGRPANGAKGYCNAHYLRLRKFGNPLMYYGKQVSDNFFQERNKT